MHRSTAFVAVVFATLLSLVGLIGLGPALHDANAQDATTAGHPLVGTWIVDSDPETEGNAPETAIFGADGSFTDAQADGTIALGTWAATGPNTANLTFSQYFANDDDMNDGGFTVRASLEVSADGASFSGTYTIEFLNPDGTTSGQVGPETVTGTRMVAEAPGTPVMSAEDFFSQFEGTPEATPAA